MNIILANQKGLYGNHLVTESEGMDVEDDDVLDIIDKTKILMILNENEYWQPQETPQNYIVLDNQNNNHGSETGNFFIYFYITFQCLYKLFLKFLESIASTLVLTNSSIADTISSDIIPEYILENNIFSPSDKNLEFKSFKDFQLNKLPQTFYEIFKRNEKLLPSQLDDLIHIVIDQLRLISPHIPVAVIRDVVDKLVQKYPQSLLNTDKEGRNMCADNSVLITKFVNHNNYKNSKKRLNQITPEINLKSRKKAKTFKNSCQPGRWQPDQSSESEKSVKEKQDWLKKIIPKKFLNSDEAYLVGQYMESTYPFQRRFLNNFKNPPSIEQIKNEWPFLMKQDSLLKHFETLTDISVSKYFDSYQSNKNVIIKYFKEKNKYTMDSDADISEDEQCFKFIASKFAEDLKSLFKQYPVSYTM